MPDRAPRLPWRLWGRAVRGAALMLALAAGGAAAECIEAARYAEPTGRHAHGVLGDSIEYGALVLTVAGADGRNRVTVRLPEDRVFEDLEPRLADLELDGCPEVVVVETQVALGAQLAVYGADGGKIAATPHIGQSHRWLAPVGAADLDGDGRVEIAYVDRPHLARVLRIWRFDDGHLVEVAAQGGLSNHRIGWDRIAGGIRSCGAGPEMILADAQWARVMAVRFDGALSARSLGPYSPEAMSRALDCR